MVDYIKKMMEIKKVFRFGMYHKDFQESVADHSFMVAFLAINLIDEYKLDFLNFEKVLHFALYHDLCEIGLDFDFDAYCTTNNSDLRTQKHQYEDHVIKTISDQFKNHRLLETYLEYNKQDSLEAKFVKAVDKLETTLQILKVGGEHYENVDFVPVYCDKAIENFPELKPFYKKVKQELKKEYNKYGIEWKEEYNKSI